MNWQDVLTNARNIALARLAPHRLKVAAGLGAVLIGAVVWGAASPAYSTTFYIVKWNRTGLCTVVDERPEDRRRYKTMWFTTFQKVADQKMREFKETGRCGRVALRR